MMCRVTSRGSHRPAIAANLTALSPLADAGDLARDEQQGCIPLDLQHEVARGAAMVEQHAQAIKASDWNRVDAVDDVARQKQHLHSWA